MSNNSPWIHQLNHERATKKLREDLNVEVAIIGAGIAGISTAFYLLKHTDKKVVILEGYKLAHGATGHNGGHMVTYFERPFVELVAEFGLEMAVQGQRDVDSSWQLVEEMYTEAGIDIPMVRFEGHAGLSNKEQVLERLENDFLKRKGGLHTKVVELWDGADFIGELPAKYHDQIAFVSREEIALKLETFDSQYIAVTSSQKGVMNSALFCQEVMAYLLKNYADRLALYEYTPVNKVVIHESKVIIDAEEHVVECEKVVLCTNGFEGLDIITPDGLAVNSRFHHNLHGIIGYMSGYLESYTGVPMANNYHPKVVDPSMTDNPGNPYFYVTRRPFEYEKEKRHNLICIGGPDHSLEHLSKYNRDLEFSEVASGQLNQFVKQTYEKKDNLEYLFMWHGVMGYTKNMLRMVGPDPSYSALYYNLGCNGVGLMPSVFAGQKVARLISGEKFEKSIFDVPKIVSAEKLVNSKEKADVSADLL